jgi:seryl-tRNA synthetase
MEARTETFLKRMDEEDPALLIVRDHLDEFRGHLNKEITKLRFEFHNMWTDQAQELQHLRNDCRDVQREMGPMRKHQQVFAEKIDKEMKRNKEDNDTAIDKLNDLVRELTSVAISTDMHL